MQRSEVETVVAYSDDCLEVEIFSCIRKDITAMKKKEQFRLLREGSYKDGTAWAVFSIDRSKFDIARSAKSTRNLSDEQRQEIADRFKNAVGRDDRA